MTEPNWLIAPDRATHYSPETNGNWPCFWHLEHGAPVRVWPIHNGRLNTLDGVETSAIDLVTRAALIARPTNQVVGNAEWNGVGLPPVGTVCEWKLKQEFGYVAAEVLFVSEKSIVLRRKDGFEWQEVPSRCVFRPIRTPEQIAEERREAAIIEMESAIKDSALGLSTTRMACAALYDAGYRKLTLS